MQIERVDPRDDQAFAAWFAVLEAVELDDRPGERGWLPGELRAQALAALVPERDRELVLLVARDGSGAVGAVQLELPTRDNLHLGEAFLVVLPDRRRRGAGQALLQAVQELMRADGRMTLIAYSDEPPGRTSAASAGAGERLGFERAQTEVRRDIDLPLPAERAAALRADCAPHAAGYEIVTWRDRAPTRLLDDLAVLHQRMSTDVPLAELEITQESFDAARVQRHEQLALDMGRALLGAGAVHLASGRLVAYTDMAVSLHAPERAYQWNTIVLDEHRGHRLGTLVKLASLERLSAEVPRTRMISTWNAEENEAMIRVNDALGARTNGRETAWQKRLAT